MLEGVQNPDKHLRWKFYAKIACYVFDWVLNVPLNATSFNIFGNNLGLPDQYFNFFKSNSKRPKSEWKHFIVFTVKKGQSL